MLWPSIHAAVDVYQRRRSADADHYELIWRLVHICECTVVTLAAAAVSRLRQMDRKPEFLKLRERCYGITWNSTEASLDKGIGALDGSIDKWIEIVQYVPGLDVKSSKFLTALQKLLVGAKNEASTDSTNCIDLAPLVRAWGRACDVPPSVIPEKVSVKDAFQAINSFRNRFAHVPFPYDQIQDIYRELETCTFRLFEISPTAANDESPLSGSLALKDSLLQGAGHRNTPEGWTAVDCETFVWGKKGTQESWDARPFIFLDKMMRPYLLSRLKNEAGSWEYTRYLAEANAVYSLNKSDLLKLLPRPDESDYHKDEPPPKEVKSSNDAVIHGVPGIYGREEAFAAVRRRDFDPAIQFWKSEVESNPDYHSGWHRLGYAQREHGVDLMDAEPQKAAQLLKESIESFSHAILHNNPEYAAEAYYNRSKAYWRLSRLNGDSVANFQEAVKDAQIAVARFYDQRFISWCEFLKEYPMNILAVHAETAGQSE
jgi:tetratricopeptide (TPR) repeat protein